MLRVYEYIHDYHPQWDPPDLPKSQIILDDCINDARGYALAVYVTDPTDFGRLVDLIRDWARGFAREVLADAGKVEGRGSWLRS